MRKMPRLLLSALVLLVSALSSTSPQAEAALLWQAKVDPWVLRQAAAGQADFLLVLRTQADLSGAAQLDSKVEKGRYVYDRLRQVAQRTQAPLVAALEARGLHYRRFWVANMLWVRGDLSAVQALAARPDVAHLYADPWVRLDLPNPSPAQPELQTPQAIPWNITRVNAPQVWAAGYTGQGVVIGGQDTGYQWDHPVLKPHYRGWDGRAASHDYNWHDAIHEDIGQSDANECGYDSPVPCDDLGHGTHTLGILVGDDGAGTQVGVAPDARWIGCRNMEGGYGKPSTYSECYQWFIAPWPVGGDPFSDGDPSLAPDVINNSWGCPPSEGCTDPNVLLAVVQAVRAAGILTAQAAGNDGNDGIDDCSTIIDPAAIYAASFTVGNTDLNDNISGSSSRGPVTIDGSGRLKPDVSAPGTGIYSSIPTNTYDWFTGTSMAAPHVVGVAALLISANPGLSGQVDSLETLIERSALPRTSAETCGGIPGSQVPNNTYGWGRVDAWAALQENVLSLRGGVSSQQIEPGGSLTYTFSLTHTAVLTPTSNAVLFDPLPAGVTFVTATLPHTFDGSSVRWDFVSLGPLESHRVELVVRLPLTASGTLTNSGYSAWSDQVSPVGGAALSTQVVPFSLGLHKAASAQTILPGELLTYTLTLSNQHPFAAAHSLVLTDTLPAQANFVSATSPFTRQERLLRWEFPLLGPGASQVVRLVVRVSPSARGAIINRLYAASSREAPVPLWGSAVRALVPSLYLPWLGREP